MDELVDFGFAIQSILKVLAHLAVEPYTQLVGRGIITSEEAAESLRLDADMYEKMALPAPLVGAAIAKDLRDYAAKIFDPKPLRPSANLKVV
jgi:hypothetical protein